MRRMYLIPWHTYLFFFHLKKKKTALQSTLHGLPMSPKAVVTSTGVSFGGGWQCGRETSAKPKSSVPVHDSFSLSDVMSSFVTEGIEGFLEDSSKFWHQTDLSRKPGSSTDWLRGPVCSINICWESCLSQLPGLKLGGGTPGSDDCAEDRWDSVWLG